jgi:hypothetical protein
MACCSIGERMKLLEYEYPTRVTFNETLQVTQAAVKRFGGIIPNIEASKILGYTFSNPSAIPGYVYKRFDEMEMFGLLERDKVNRGLKATALGKRAFADYQVEANKARVEAIKKIPIVEKAFTDWKGVVPEDDAFPAQLVELTSANRKEAEQHVANLKKLISECFPILQSPESEQPSPLRRAEIIQPDYGAGRGEKRLVDTPSGETGSTGKDYGELRTTIGSVNIVDKVTLGVAKHILDALDDHFAEQAKSPRKGKDKDSKPGE